MFKNWRIPIFLFFNLIPIPIQALVLRTTPVILFNASAPTQTLSGGSLGWTGNLATGFGLLTSFSIFETPFDLELGAIYQGEASERTLSGSPLTQEFHRLHLPLILRFNLDESFGFGLGGYASMASGKVLTTYQGISTVSTFAGSGIDERDLGLVFSARANFRLWPRLRLLVDGRYLHGLRNLAKSPDGSPIPAGDLLNTRSMQAYVGLSYEFSFNNP